MTNTKYAEIVARFKGNHRRVWLFDNKQDADHAHYVLSCQDHQFVTFHYLDGEAIVNRRLLIEASLHYPQQSLMSVNDVITKANTEHDAISNPDLHRET